MELVVVMVVLGILASVAMPKFFGASKFHEMGHADAVASAIRFAQKAAIASGCDVRAEVTPNGFALWQRATSCSVGSFTRALPRSGGTQWAAPTPTGVVVSALDLYFDASGRPHLQADGSMLTARSNVSVGTHVIAIEHTTGFVH